MLLHFRQLFWRYFFDQTVLGSHYLDLSITNPLRLVVRGLQVSWGGGTIPEQRNSASNRPWGCSWRLVFILHSPKDLPLYYMWNTHI